MEQNKKSRIKKGINLIQSMIYDIRGHKIMFDNDLADCIRLKQKTSTER